MALTLSSTKQRIALGFLSIATIGCFVSAGWLLYDSVVVRGGFRLGVPYSYAINQSINNDVSYVENSYFPNGPGVNTAYIGDLTDVVKTRLHFSFNGTSVENLTYTYDVKAVVRGTYTVPGSDSDISSVWRKEFQLVKPVTKTASAKGFSVDKTVVIPFAEYRKLVEDFRLSLALPVTSELEIKFNIQTTGMVAGEELSDSRSSTISTPLNVQIYQLATKYDKADKKSLNNRPQTDGGEMIRAELAGAILLSLLGAVFVGMILHRSIQKSAYQRELQKIYRYHDGIIIRTSKHVAIPAHKTIVPVKSFDDILNLEEETKSPIIANTLGDSATQFLINQGDTVYMYTLGKEPIDIIKQDQLESIGESIEQTHKLVTDVKPSRKKQSKKKIQ